jgi:hypothetical protein
VDSVFKVLLQVPGVQLDLIGEDDLIRDNG